MTDTKAPFDAYELLVEIRYALRKQQHIYREQGYALIPVNVTQELGPATWLVGENISGPEDVPSLAAVASAFEQFQTSYDAVFVDDPSISSRWRVISAEMVG